MIEVPDWLIATVLRFSREIKERTGRAPGGDLQMSITQELGKRLGIPLKGKYTLCGINLEVR